MDPLDALYAKYNILMDAGPNILQHEDTYKEILQSVKGSNNEKRLASQFIAKFSGKFPHLMDTSVDYMLDLCEDEDGLIRKQAIKDLSTIGKDAMEYVAKISDILTQLLVTEEPTEAQIVNASLVTLYKMHPTGFMEGIFSQICCEDLVDIVREKAIQFLGAKVKVLPEDKMTRDFEEQLVNHIKTGMKDCNQEEFVIFMDILSGLKIMKLMSGQQTLLNIITTNCEDILTSNEPLTEETVDQLLMCVKYAIPVFSPFVTSNRFLMFYCTNVLPQVSDLVSKIPKVDLEIYQNLAEMVTNSVVDHPSVPLVLPTVQQRILNQLLPFIPLPPVEVDVTPEPELQLTHVESLLFSFYQVLKHQPDFLVKDEPKLKDFRLRLQFLARGVQNYQKGLKEAVNESGKQAKLTEQDQVKLKLRQTALTSASNITTLIRDLFHSPPTFKSTISLSWRPPTKGSTRKFSSIHSDGDGVTVTTSATPKQVEVKSDQVNPQVKRKNPIGFPEKDPADAIKKVVMDIKPTVTGSVPVTKRFPQTMAQTGNTNNNNNNPFRTGYRGGRGGSYNNQWTRGQGRARARGPYAKRFN